MSLCLTDVAYVGTLRHGFDITTVNNVGFFTVVGQDTTIRGVAMSPDGVYLFICGGSSDQVHRYILSTPYDVTTAVFSQTSTLDPGHTNPYGLFFRKDGLKMYGTDLAGDMVFEYDLSTAWDISNSSLSFNGSYNIPIAITPRGMTFSLDGVHMYIATPSVGPTNQSIRHFTLSTPWDITTASETSPLDLTGTENQPQGVHINPQGTRLFIAGGASDALLQYDLSTAFDLTTAVSAGSISVILEDGQPRGLHLTHNGMKAYMGGGVNDGVFEYDLNLS